MGHVRCKNKHELYILSNFLDTLCRLGIVDDVEKRFPKYWAARKLWEGSYKL